MPRLCARLRERLSPPRFADEEQTTFARMVWLLCLVLLPALVIPAALSWISGYQRTFRALCLQAVVTAAALWLTRRGRLQAAASVLFCSLLACAVYLVLISPAGFHDIASMMMFPALLAVASVVHKWRFYFWFVAAEVLAVTAVGVAEMRGWTRAGAALRQGTDWTLLVDIDVILLVTAVAGVLIVQQLRNSLSESRRNASALRAIARATTGGGAAFHGGLVSELARAVGVGNAMLAELLPGTPRRARTVALFDRGELAPNFEFNLAGTPFDELLQSGFSHYPRDVQKLFPQDRQLAARRGEGFVGVLLLDASGAALGFLAFLDSQPIQEAVPARSLLTVFAARAATELQRQHAEQALRDSEERYRTVIESLGEGVAITDEQERFLIANPAAEQIFGVPPGGLAGRILNEFVPPAELPKLQGEAARRRRGEKTSYELQIVRPDGARRTILVTVAPQYDRDGRSMRCVGVLRDITASRQLEERFRLMAHALGSTNDCVCITDAEDRFLYVNEAFSRTYGYRESELQGRHVGILRSDRNDPELLNQITAATAANGWQGELWNRSKDGREFPVALSTSAVRDEQGRMIALTGVARDVTERKRAEEALKESEARFRDLVENTSDLIWEWDAQGRYVYCSPAIAETLGLEPKQLLGSTFLDVATSEEWAVRKPLIDDFLAHPRPFRGLELKKRHRDGSVRVLELNGVPILDAAGRFTGYRGITRDITERKRTEEELRAAKTSAEAADRAKSEFLATISHEIRTPMNGIIGMTELLLGTGLSGEQRSYGEALKSSSEALLAILNDVLDFSKIEAGRVELEAIPFDLLACLEEVEALLAVSAHARHLELALLYGRDVPRRVIGDPGRIRQVILNLVSNAIKFTERGSVWVEVACPHKSPERAAIRITVFDTGIGIPPDKLLLVFSKFTQADSSTRRRYGGTGLGLAIVKQLVERMNGSIEVASQPGEGSAFALVLNLPLGPGPEPEPFPPADLQGTRVLIVDDFAINRFVFLDLCLRWGMRPDEASSGAEALRMVAAAWRDGDPYRALLLDSIMPEMDGEDVARRLRATPEGREPAIVMATSSAHQGEADRVRAAGCDGYLVKPIKSGLLQEALVRVLGARSAGVPQSLVTDNSLVKLRNCLAPAPSSAGKPFAGCRALLAEDNLINQKLGIRLLEKLGCSVDLAVNGLEAARLSANNAYDVVFMDCQMPEMDGFEATAEIRRREGAGRRTPIVAITAYAMDGDRERCLLAGMDDYIPKPIRPGVLEQALQTWFSRAQDAAQTETSRPEDDLQTLA